MKDKVLIDLIEAYMLANGLTQKDMAEKIGTTQATLSRIVSGKRGVSPKMYPKVCDLLGITKTKKTSHMTEKITLKIGNEYKDGAFPDAQFDHAYWVIPKETTQILFGNMVLAMAVQLGCWQHDMLKLDAIGNFYIPPGAKVILSLLSGQNIELKGIPSFHVDKSMFSEEERYMGLGFISIINNAIDYAKIKSANKWIALEKEKPVVGTEVIVVLDYSDYVPGRKRIAMANVHFTDNEISYGGPNALTGSGTLTGLYFSLPAIVKPGIVTHWMPKPQFP